MSQSFYAVVSENGECLPEGFLRLADARYAAREAQYRTDDTWRAVHVTVFGESEGQREDPYRPLRPPPSMASMETVIAVAWDSWAARQR